MTTTRRRARVAAVASATVLLLALAGGCSGDDDSEPSPGADPQAPTSTPTTPPLETTATIGRVAGSKLPEARRETLKKQVRPIVDRWIDGAYVGGSWPRTDVGDAFAGFSAGARRDATTDLRLMSNADIGDRVTGVTATRRVVRLDVLAVRGRATAVTARVDLRFETTGELARTESVTGRLFLTRAEDGWEVFGYDVASGEGAGGTTDDKGRNEKKDTSDEKGSNR